MIYIYISYQKYENPQLENDIYIYIYHLKNLSKNKTAIGKIFYIYIYIYISSPKYENLQLENDIYIYIYVSSHKYKKNHAINIYIYIYIYIISKI